MSGVKQFYAGQTVFVTGFTGYMGKSLVEKLLWSCSDVHRIYVLIRVKKGQSAQERLAQALESLAFTRLKKNYPERLSKVVGISGDVTEDGLGLSEEDTSRVVQETSIVFHCAASVRFDDPLIFATNINARAAKRILDLAKQMPNLKSLVVTSTAYVNCDRKHVEEKVYQPKIDWRVLFRILEDIDETTVSVLTQKIIGVMPNTYVFTKSIAEHIFSEGSRYVPTIICRPTVVAPAVQEPLPGWVDNVYGPTGILLGGMTGVMRVQLMDPDSHIDYVFCDHATNATIALAPAAPSPLSVPTKQT